MTSYPKNVQFTNLKINSDQDLFAINPTVPVNNDDDIMNALCNDSCLIPDLDLLSPCNGILAALKVNGSVAICKGINIGNTDVEIKGTIRFNGKNFEGYNCEGWVPLDCCSDDNNCKIYNIDNELNGSISVGDLVTFTTQCDSTKPSHSVHKLLCDKWEWSARISSLSNEKQPKIAVDKCGKAFVVGYTDSTILPNFYNSDDTIAINNFDMHNFFNKYIFIGKINSIGCWEYVAVIDSKLDEIDPEITVGCSGSLYITGQGGGSNNGPIFYNYDSSIGLEGLNSQFPETFIAKLNSVGIWLWSAEIQYSTASNKIQPNISVDMCDNLYVVNDVLENSIATVYDSDKNSHILPVSAQKQILVALYSGNGSVNWITRVGGLYDQINGNVMVDGFGNAYISGIGNEPVYYDKFDQVEQTGVSEIIDQLWIGKICFTGNWEWNTRITNVDSNYGEIVLSNDIDCNLYLGFVANDYPEFYNVGNSLAISGNNQNSIYVGKISSNGFWYWTANIVSSSSNKNITSVDVDGNGYIYVSGDTDGDLDFYNIDGTLGEKLFNKNSNKYVWLGRLNAYGSWDWAIQIYGENDNFNPSVSVDSSGNIFLTGESAPTNDNILYLDPPNNILGIEGKGSPTGEIFVGKIVNESQSAKMIGVIKEILEDGKVCVQFDGEIVFKNASFIPGMSYYYDCYSEEIVSHCYKNMRLLRNVGIACDTDSLLWNSTGKFCVNKDKNCSQVITSSDISAQTISGTFIYTTNPGYTNDPKTFYKATKINNVVTLTIDKFEGDPDVNNPDKFKTDIGVLNILFRPSHEITTIVKVKDNGTETMGTLTVNVDGSISFTNNFGDFTNNNQMIGNCTINYVI